MLDSDKPANLSEVSTAYQLLCSKGENEGPTPNELLTAMRDYQVEKMISNKDATDDISKSIDNFYRIVTTLVAIPDQDKALNGNKYDQECFATDPAHPMVCLALYLSNMEPSLYTHLIQFSNKFGGCQWKEVDGEGEWQLVFNNDEDISKVRQLGPLAWVLQKILQLLPGKELGKLPSSRWGGEYSQQTPLWSQLGFYSLAFNVFRSGF